MSHLPTAPDAAQRAVARALAYLRQPLARVERVGSGYRLRLGPDRRTRPAMSFEAAVFDALAAKGALSPYRDGWVLARTARALEAADRAGRPGVIEGERAVVEPDGHIVPRRANLGESPIAWLARRRDSRGQPWLTPPEIAAAMRLRADHDLCGVQGRLTMDWSGMPRSGAGWTGVDPAETHRAARQRVANALAAVGPGLREVLESVVLTGSALEAAERAQGLPRRAGKTVLKLALGRLAEHYGLE
jgi:hypothetical protein